MYSMRPEWPTRLAISTTASWIDAAAGARVNSATEAEGIWKV